jgi:hypothetical protein
MNVLTNVSVVVVSILLCTHTAEMSRLYLVVSGIILLAQKSICFASHYQDLPRDDNLLCFGISRKRGIFLRFAGVSLVDDDSFLQFPFHGRRMRELLIASFFDSMVVDCFPFLAVARFLLFGSCPHTCCSAGQKVAQTTRQQVSDLTRHKRSGTKV